MCIRDRIWLDRTAKDFEKLGVYTDAQQAGPEFSEHKKALFACTEEEYPAKAAEFSPATYITKDCPPFLIQPGTKAVSYTHLKRKLQRIPQE